MEERSRTTNDHSFANIETTISNSKQFDRFREVLRTEDRDAARDECRSLFEAGVEHHDMVRVLLSDIEGKAVGNASWLPSASVINLSANPVHVKLQPLADRHKFVVFGERQPEFRRT